MEESYYQFDDATDGGYYQKLAGINQIAQVEENTIPRYVADEMTEEEYLNTLKGNVFNDLVIASEANSVGVQPPITGTYKEGLDGFSIAAGVLNAAVHMADQPINDFKSLGPKVTTQFIRSASYAAKITGIIGNALGLVSVYNDYATLMNNPKPTIADYAKFGLSVGMLGLKASPINFGISIGYGLLNAAGYNPIDVFYNNVSRH